MPMPILRSAVALLAAAALHTGAHAQAPVTTPPEDDLSKVDRPINVWLATRPTVSVAFRGDYGTVRVTGSLEESPKEKVKLSTKSGATHEVAWSELFSLQQIRTAIIGFPPGSLAALLRPDRSTQSISGSSFGGPSAGTLASSDIGLEPDTWRVEQRPSGNVVVDSPQVGRVVIPVPRIEEYRQIPITATVTALPAGIVKVELLKGTIVTVDLKDLVLFRRDFAAGVVTLVLQDQQTVVGKLLELPKITVVFAPDSSTRKSVELMDVVYLTFSGPNGAQLLAGSGY